MRSIVWAVILKRIGGLLADDYIPCSHKFVVEGDIWSCPSSRSYSCIPNLTSLYGINHHLTSILMLNCYQFRTRMQDKRAMKHIKQRQPRYVQLKDKPSSWYERHLIRWSAPRAGRGRPYHQLLTRKARSSPRCWTVAREISHINAVAYIAAPRWPS